MLARLEFSNAERPPSSPFDDNVIFLVAGKEEFDGIREPFWDICTEILCIYFDPESSDNQRAIAYFIQLQLYTYRNLRLAVPLPFYLSPSSGTVSPGSGGGGLQEQITEKRGISNGVGEECVGSITRDAEAG